MFTRPDEQLTVKITVCTKGYIYIALLIHDRMPVVLEPFEPWLAGSAGIEVLKPAREDVLQMRPVSRKVNRVGNEGDLTLITAIQ